MNDAFHKGETVEKTLSGLLRTSDYWHGEREFILPKMEDREYVQFLDTLLDIRALPEVK